MQQLVVKQLQSEQLAKIKQENKSSSSCGFMGLSCAAHFVEQHESIIAAVGGIGLSLICTVCALAISAADAVYSSHGAARAFASGNYLGGVLDVLGVAADVVGGGATIRAMQFSSDAKALEAGVASFDENHAAIKAAYESYLGPGKVSRNAMRAIDSQVK